MALADDLNKLAAQDVVYLTRTLTFSSGGVSGQVSGSTEVLRGRLRQALNGDWVFNASTGQNGVVGFVLGAVVEGGSGLKSWYSSESPATGLQITITLACGIMLIVQGQPTQGSMSEVTVLTNVIPTDFTD